MKEKITIKELIAWTKKYLIAASIFFLFLSIPIIIGIKAIKLNSRPIHIPNIEEEEIAINVPEIRKVK